MDVSYYKHILEKNSEDIRNEREFEMEKIKLFANTINNSNNNPFVHINLLSKGSSVVQNNSTVYNIMLTDTQFNDLLQAIKK